MSTPSLYFCTRRQQLTTYTECRACYGRNGQLKSRYEVWSDCRFDHLKVIDQDQLERAIIALPMVEVA